MEFPRSADEYFHQAEIGMSRVDKTKRAKKLAFWLFLFYPFYSC